MSREGYRIADLTLDVGAARLTRGGEVIALPQLSFDLLVALARRAPDVVSSDELIATVWAGTAVSDETLTQRVALLRRALGDDARNPRYLRVVRSRGYQLIPEIGRDERDEVRPEPISAPVKRAPRRAIGLAGLASLSIVAAATLVVSSTREPRPASGAGPITTRPADAEELVARADAYLGRHRDRDNELAIDLYRKALAIAPNDARALAGLSLALGQRSTKFNRPAEAQEAIRLARLAIELAPGFARGHHALGLALDSQGQIAVALAAYREADRLAPDDPAALASAANLLAVSGRLAEALEANLEAAARGEASIYLEVQIGVALAKLGFDAAAAVWLERAVELKPDNVFAPVAYAELRLSRGRLREADAIAERALARGIARPELPLIRGLVALLEGDGGRARALFEEARRIDPANADAGVRLLLLDRREATGPPTSEQLAWYRDELAALAKSRAQGDAWPNGPFAATLLHAGFAAPEAAFAALDEAIELGYRDADWLLLDPMLAPLRQGPGLAARVETIRLLVEAERQRVLVAPWLPSSLLDGKAASR